MHIVVVMLFSMLPLSACADPACEDVYASCMASCVIERSAERCMQGCMAKRDRCLTLNLPKRATEKDAQATRDPRAKTPASYDALRRARPEGVTYGDWVR